MSRRKRPTDEYLQAAKRLAQIIPSLKKYKKRKTLKPAEKSAIARREKQLRYADHLIPLSPKQYESLKHQAIAPGIHALQLRNTSPDAKFRMVGRDFIVTSNGREFLYWRLDIRRKREKRTSTEQSRINKRSAKLLKTAAETAFTNLVGAFQIEHVVELAKRAFEKESSPDILMGRKRTGWRRVSQSK